VQAVALHLDNALLEQAMFATALRDAGARALDARDLGPRLRLWSTEDTLSNLKSRLRIELPTSTDAELVFAGSGDFHHVTALLVGRVLERTGAPLTVIHVDNHPDWVKFARGMHCGSWVGRVARLPGVSCTMTIGVTSADIDRPSGKGADLSLVDDGLVQMFPYRSSDGGGAYKLCGREWPTIASIGEPDFIRLLTASIRTKNVYITIDKDALRTQDAVTNWDQGELSLQFLTDLIAAISQDHTLAGADVVGDWSPVRYGGHLAARAFKLAESVMDQPWARINTAHAAAVNQGTNLTLLAAMQRRST
jgi:arginase family enzyme